MLLGNICRICSCPGDYEIFAKIPTYLHANYNDFLNWQKPINKLMEETTGLKILPDDEYPKHICAICISYLKHAVAFRDQCIKNILSLRAVIKFRKSNIGDIKELCSSKENEIPMAEEDVLDYSTQRETEAANLLANISLGDHDKVNKKLLDISFPFNLDNLNVLFDNDSTLNLNTKRFKYQNNTALPEVFAEQSDEDDYQTATSSDCLEDLENSKIVNDDNTEAQNSPINQITSMASEHKCQACCRRYMMRESYLEHKNYCLQTKFLSFIKQLKDIRDSKSNMPSHEFIRNIIIHLCNIINWLNTNYNDIMVPELITNGQTAEVNNKTVISENGCLPEYSQHENRDIEESTSLHLQDRNKLNQTNLEDSWNSTTSKQLGNATFEFSSPAGMLLKNRQLESRNNKYFIKATKPPSESVDQLADVQKIESPLQVQQRHMPKLNSPNQKCSSNFQAELETKLDSTATLVNHTTYLNLNYAARCEYCDLLFDTLHAFEEHNATHHNNYRSVVRTLHKPN